MFLIIGWFYSNIKYRHVL